MGPLWEEFAVTHVRTQFEADVCRVTVTGDIDLLTAPELKRALQEAAARGCRHAIVDLAEVPYMDSSGYGALLNGVKHFRPVQGELCLVGCSRTIQRMLEITRLGTLFHMCSSLDEAHAVLSTVGDALPLPPVRSRCASSTARAADA